MKRLLCCICVLILAAGISVGCGESKDGIKVGVSLGVGTAERWVHEKQYMEDRAKELNIEIEVRLNSTDEPKTQQEDCFELIDTSPVVITGMDAQLDAVRRIVNGKQSVTMYMDLKELSTTAINEAYNMATGQKVNVNSKFDNDNGKGGIESNLITGKLVTKENVDQLLIDTGYFTREEVYGVEK